MDRRSLLGGVAALGLTAIAHGASPREITRLIQQLGSRKFREREAATKALERVGVPALEALRRAAKDDADAEVRRRAGQIVEKSDTRRRQGTWCIVSIELNGQTFKWSGRHEFSFTSDGVRAGLHLSGGGECVVDALRTPQEMDIRRYGMTLSPPPRSFLEQTYRAIYRFEKDELVLCFNPAKGAPRPTEFKTAAGSDVVVYRMRRQKPRP
jgi:uncharacterized protein (TIGR03067 family)